MNLLRPEAAVNVDVADEAARRAAASLGLPLIRLDHIDRAGPSRFSTFPAALMDDGARQAYPTPSDDSLWQAAALGTVSETARHGFSSLDVPLWTPPGDDWAGRAQLTSQTLLHSGTVQFQEQTTINGPVVTPMIIYVARRNDVEDCRMFWNIRALRSLLIDPQRVVVVPDTGTEHWHEFDRSLASVLTASTDVEPDVIIASIKVSAEKLDAIAQRFGLQASSAPIRSARAWPPPPLRTAPHTYRLNLEVLHYFVFERIYGQMREVRVQAFRSGTRLALQSPVSFRSQGYALMRVRGPALDPYPRKDSIATMILDNAVWRRDELEIGVAAQATYGLDLRLPTLRQVLERLLTTRGIEHSLSEKGALAVGLLRDSTTAELLLQPHVRVLIETLTTPRRAHLIRRLTQLVAEASVPDVAALIEGLGGRTDRRSRSFSDLRSLVRGLTLRTVEDLADRLWLERGLHNHVPAVQNRQLRPSRGGRRSSRMPCVRTPGGLPNRSPRDCDQLPPRCNRGPSERPRTPAPPDADGTTRSRRSNSPPPARG